ncbi:UNKNOWN [Stylonychia lemnae]|uniref:Uncharacterized protein n=1 Tax=Stylonychia lemnae TaxID=5949 RepID=A0A078AWB0_STYLE|nr:UNKNOWN [Stylonychia lemnae]|eukprot:CDW85522.1 UNKNOWN [Stylonychia lemnae]
MIYRLTLLIILTLTIFFQPALLKGSKKKKSLSPVEKKLKNLKEEYRKTKCAHLGDEMASQCYYYYISPHCFKQVFGETGVEWGEFLGNKDQDYTDCYKKIQTGK